MRLMQEFKEFAVRGNVVDMAVGIIIGAAFGRIVNSLVADILTPPLGLLIGGIDLSEQKLMLRDPQPATDTAEAVAEVSINYGSFFDALLTFIIVAFAVFLLVKAVNTMRRKQAEAPPPAAPPAPTPDQELLAEIRDLLRTPPHR